MAEFYMLIFLSKIQVLKRNTHKTNEKILTKDRKKAMLSLTGPCQTFSYISPIMLDDRDASISKVTTDFI